MIKCVRVKHGLANLPSAWVKSLSESMHRIIRETINYDAVNNASFLETIKEKVFQQQKDELIREIHGMEEYRLVPELSKYSIGPLKCSSMTLDQRKFHDIKVLKMGHNDVRGNKNTLPCLSVPLEIVISENILLPYGTLK